MLYNKEYSVLCVSNDCDILYRSWCNTDGYLKIASDSQTCEKFMKIETSARNF